MKVVGRLMEMRVHVNQRYDAGKWRERGEGRGWERGEGREEGRGERGEVRGEGGIFIDFFQT
jgi:hypothetical protein